MNCKRFVRLLRNFVAKRLRARIDSSTRMEAWTGLMRSLIQNNEGSLITKAYEFMAKEIEIARAVNDVPISYSDPIDKAVVEINSEICKSSERLFSVTSSCDILVCYSGAFDKKENSEKTYEIIWRCLSEQIYRKRDDLLYEYWTYAIQRYSFYFQYSQNSAAAKNRYIEFHIALCAHLLCEKRYELLADIMFKSTCTPPEYKLIPSSFDTLFDWYLMANASSYSDRYYFEDKYSFFSDKDIFNSNLERINICRYLALLCLRLKYVEPNYAINLFAFNEKFGDSLKNVKRYLDACKCLIEDIKGIDNTVSDEVFANRRYENQDIDVLKIVEHYRTYLEERYTRIKEEQRISSNIVESYRKSIGEILEEKVRLYQCLLESRSSIPKCSEDVVEQYNNGVYANNSSFSDLLESSIFKDDQPIAVANLDHSIAEYVASQLYHNVAAVFSSRCGTLKSVYYDDVIMAFQRMTPSSQNHVALCFGVGSILQTRLKLSQVSENIYQYNGVKVYLFPGSPALDPFIVFVRKSEMPKIEINDPTDNIKIKYGLKKLTEKYSIYFGVVDLKDNSCLKTWLLNDNKMTDEQLKDKCFVSTYLYYHLYIPANSIVGGFKLVDQFSSNVNEVEAIDMLPQ